MIFIIKVTTNKEEKVIDMVADRAEKKNLNIFSVFRPRGLRGYIFLEAEDRESAEESAFELPYVKGIIGKTIEYSEIQNMIEPSVETSQLRKGHCRDDWFNFEGRKSESFKS
jgi:transcription elongation factor Spt5